MYLFHNYFLQNYKIYYYLQKEIMEFYFVRIILLVSIS